jgi:hypothetical protein
MPDETDPEWLSPLLLLGVCTSCIGLAGAGALVVAVAGAFWANVLVGVAVASLIGGWMVLGNPFRDREACEVEAGTGEAGEARD